MDDRYFIAARTALGLLPALTGVAYIAVTTPVQSDARAVRIGWFIFRIVFFGLPATIGFYTMFGAPDNLRTLFLWGWLISGFLLAALVVSTFTSGVDPDEHQGTTRDVLTYQKFESALPMMFLLIFLIGAGIISFYPSDNPMARAGAVAAGMVLALHALSYWSDRLLMGRWKTPLVLAPAALTHLYFQLGPMEELSQFIALLIMGLAVFIIGLPIAEVVVGDRSRRRTNMLVVFFTSLLVAVMITALMTT